MNPEGNLILLRTTQRLAGEVAPKLDNAFGQSQIGLMGIMLTFVAQEYERGAQIRVEENRDLRALFAEAKPHVSDPDLYARLAFAAQSKDDSLLISELNKANYSLRRLLIELQTHVEEHSGSRVFDKQIWQLLQRMANRRMVRLGG